MDSSVPLMIRESDLGSLIPDTYHLKVKIILVQLGVKDKRELEKCHGQTQSKSLNSESPVLYKMPHYLTRSYHHSNLTLLDNEGVLNEKATLIIKKYTFLSRPSVFAIEVTKLLVMSQLLV